jgi:hypothetical protein
MNCLAKRPSSSAGATPEQSMNSKETSCLISTPALFLSQPKYPMQESVIPADRKLQFALETGMKLKSRQPSCNPPARALQTDSQSLPEAEQIPPARSLGNLDLPGSRPRAGIEPPLIEA